MTTPCLSVLTARGPARIIAEGGSQAWRLNPENARKLSYCVCVQNRHNGLWGGADQEHHHGFLIGRITDVVPSPEGEPGRYLVAFSEYARIDCANAWPGLRNPIRYATLEEFDLGDPDNLNWQPMPDSITATVIGESEDEEKDGFGPLTFSEAKAGLALGLGVPESAIEIVIRY